MDPLIDRAALGVTELLSNVHRHARPDKSCTVEIELLPDRLTVSVRDHDPRLPVPADAGDSTDAGPLATCGRGLAMVAAVSESWGARPDGENGKVVWFTLPAPAAVRGPVAGAPRRAAERQPTATHPAESRPTPTPTPTPAPVGAGTPVGTGAPTPVGAWAQVRAGTPTAVGAGAPVGAGSAVGTGSAVDAGTPTSLCAPGPVGAGSTVGAGTPGGVAAPASAGANRPRSA
jgi:hypothetical protein